MDAINNKTGKHIVSAVVTLQAIPWEGEWKKDADGRPVPTILLDDEATADPCPDNFCAPVRYFDAEGNECGIEDITLVK